MTEQFQDASIECSDCRASFVWTAGAQAFFADRQLTPPKRCASCREAKRQRYAELQQDRGDGPPAA